MISRRSALQPMLVQETASESEDMHWLLVSAEHHPSQGGIGAYVAAFIKGATANGWCVDLITRDSNLLPAASLNHVVRTIDEEPEFDARIPTLRRIERIRPYRFGLWSLAVAKKLLTLKLKHRPDVVEFADCQAQGYVSLNSHRVRSRFAGVPMIVHAHTPMFVEERINAEDESRFGRAIYHAWERSAIERADGVIVTSRLLRDRLDAKRTMVTPCPLDIEKRSPSRGNDFSGDRIVLLGSAQPRKGVDCWARSLNQVLARREDVRAVLIGPDTNSAPGGGSMVEYITQLVDTAVRDRFSWLGPLDHDRALNEIAAARVVVVPSRLESFSYAAAEAILLGRRVIVSDMVGLTEHVERITTVPAGDADALAEAQLHTMRQGQSCTTDTVDLRRRLIDACSIQNLLSAREEFVESLNGSPGIPRIYGEDDAIERMEAGLAQIERAEQAEQRRSESEAQQPLSICLESSMSKVDH